MWGHLEGLRKGHRATPTETSLCPRPPCAGTHLCLPRCQARPQTVYRGSGRSLAPLPPGTSPVGRHFQAEGHLEVHELLPVLQHPGDLHPQALLLLLQGLHRQLRVAQRGQGYPSPA